MKVYFLNLFCFEVFKSSYTFLSFFKYQFIRGKPAKSGQNNLESFEILALFKYNIDHLNLLFTWFVLIKK